ncbi:DnaJ-like protein subfamily B member 13 [Trichoplax sp. H2]|uniref:DnaJ homolog subfamily B member 13 n=1 Tax=Trichoplax adhaerens TaxID=10228 RepID=B3RYC3_TRIAD|nr:hypothetical protein TRIADDRAFT_25148 [Trichoplax adhaerens]EDV25013.1 hypothetical protein TRIADDRAFT_25148 [Trichoplax adhaerens]RDD45902.1 DnaJ-like protein subfamily B member 13 [Trichoplax sp. H2]|eukprot:XP_002112903.1 hypothetical protein TRIADDRAFT_25148 [Trichoplax adhaerens]
MGKDYYKILQITQNVKSQDIKKAYRKFALKYHPDRNTAIDAVDKFKEVSEAYDVLSNGIRRAIYDQYGEEGLKAGVPMSEAEGQTFTEGYVFHGDAERVFREFFGGNNPYADYFQPESDADMGFGGIRGRGRKKQDSPVEKELLLSLEELYTGCIKKMKVSRRVLNDDGHTTSIREKILTIPVKKGWKPGTRITFPQKGDEGPNNIAADIVFIVKDREHDRFTRSEVDLCYKAKISLADALAGCLIEIQTLDNRILSIPINEIVKPGFTKTVPGEGMPISNESNKKGNLIIAFDIIFPKHLTPEKKSMARKALS